MDLTKVKYYLGRIALVDWILAGVILALGLLVSYSTAFPDDFEPFVSSDISQPLRTTTVPYTYLCILTFGFGGLVTAVVWTSFSGPQLLPKALAAFYFSLCLALSTCCVVKRLVLRPRPDTIAQCGGDGSYRQCSTALSGADLLDQFYSFPSGHAGESMSTGVFLALLLHHVWKSPTMIACVLKLLPVLASIAIGATRIIDRAHHADDVLVGWMIGAFAAFITFRTFARSAPTRSLPGRSRAVSDSSVMSLSARGYV